MLLVAVIFVMVLLEPSHGFARRRIKFKRCHREVRMPKALFMTCANKHGVCELRKGETHILRAVFIPNHNATNVDSHVRWNSWLEIPLPNQERDACNNAIKCPVIKNHITRFTYNLHIEDFWPRKVYPVIWTLSDKDTDEELLCFKFQINIK